MINLIKLKGEKTGFEFGKKQGFQWKVDITYIIGNFKNPLVSREQLNNKQGATKNNGEIN